MKNIFLALIFLLIISGCYTMINHPKVEVYYEKENGEEYLTEDYDVFVDEDCSTCHDEFFVQNHFSPLVPAHDSNTNWDDIPWWLDTKYLMFFSGIDTSESGDYGYQHVNSQQRTQIPSAQQGGYLPNTGGGASAAGGSSAITPSPPPENPTPRTRSAVTNQDSGNSSKSTETTSKKKVAKFMRKLIFIIGIFSSITLFGQFAEDAAALLENQYGFGAKSIGMGSAFSAVSDDYSAIYWNPAGLAQIKKMEFYAGLSHLSYDSDATYLGSQLNSSSNFTKLSSIGLVFPVPTYQGSLVFALGYQRVKDFDNTLQFTGFSSSSNGLNFIYDTGDTLFFDKDIQQEELIQQDGNLNNWSFAGAMDISPNVSVGATLNFWTGSSSYLFDYIQTDTENNYPTLNDPYRNIDFYSYALSQKILSEYSAFQLKLGLLLKPSNSLRVGLNIALPSTLNIIEKYNDSDVIVYDDGFEDPVEGDPSEFEYDVSMPFQFGIGAAYKFNNLTVSLDLEYLDVSQVEFELPSDVGLNSDYSALLDENTRIKEIYQSKLKLKAGAEYFWEDQNLMFRGGYMLDPSSLQDAPSDYDRQFLTGGVGIIVDKQFIIDLAYMYGYWKNFSSDSYTPAGTDEDITYQKIFLTTSFRF